MEETLFHPTEWQRKETLGDDALQDFDAVGMATRITFNQRKFLTSCAERKGWKKR